MALSKTFNTLCHDVLIAKLDAYSFSSKSLSYIHSHLNKRFQKTNVNCDFSLWEKFFSGVHQGSILGHFYCIYVYINDILFFVDEAFLINYEDDTPLYSAQNTTYLVPHNYMVLNLVKCYYMTSGPNTTKMNFSLKMAQLYLLSAEKHAVLKITIDFHLTFYSHLKQLCKKVANALNALTRIASYRTHNPK